MNVSYNNLFLIKNAIFNKKSRACLYHFQADFCINITEAWGMNISSSFYFQNTFSLMQFWNLGPKSVSKRYARFFPSLGRLSCLLLRQLPEYPREVRH